MQNIRSRIGPRTYFPLLLLVFLGMLISIRPASAYQAGDDETMPTPSDEICLACHETPDVSVELASGEQLNLSIDPGLYEASIHGQGGISCTQCHTSISGYPHPELEAVTQREFAADQNEACTDCHESSYQESLSGVHQNAVDTGNLEAALCSDCHGSHDVASFETLQINVPELCSTCHASIYELYSESVHGAALLGEGNPDVPSCVDCHGYHEIASASQDQFHLFSPQICADCHTDETLIEKYDLNPLVFETYVADFHGTTVTLFEEISPDQETNKPVCIDCHGVHNIRSVDDPESNVIQENLLNTCRRCHPNASEDFPNAWLSHYQPSWERTPIVSAVDAFYKLFIPLTVVGMLVFLVPDSVRRIRNRLLGKKHAKDK